MYTSPSWPVGQKSCLIRQTEWETVAPMTTMRSKRVAFGRSEVSSSFMSARCLQTERRHALVSRSSRPSRDTTSEQRYRGDYVVLSRPASPKSARFCRKRTVCSESYGSEHQEVIPSSPTLLCRPMPHRFKWTGFTYVIIAKQIL